MDYQIIGNLMGEIIKYALPIGIIFTLGERVVQIFLAFAFPKMFKGGI